MTEEKLLTVVVPIYNVEKFLDKCLSSLIVHKFMDAVEILAVVDGSSDRSAIIARKYAAQYPNAFSVIEKANGGHGSVCNYGLVRARGKYIRFLDSDDWFDKENYPLYLERLSNSSADLIITPRIDEYMISGKAVLRSPFKAVLTGLQNADDFDYIANICAEAETVTTLHWATYKTECLRASGIHFSERTIYDDTAFFCRPMLTIKTFEYYSDLPVYHYLLERPGQTVGAMDERKWRITFTERSRTLNDYYSFRSEISFQKQRLLDRETWCSIACLYSTGLQKSAEAYHTFKILKADLAGINPPPTAEGCAKSKLIAELGRKLPPFMFRVTFRIYHKVKVLLGKAEA